MIYIYIYICDHIIYPHSKPKCRNSTLANKKNCGWIIGGTQ